MREPIATVGTLRLAASTRVLPKNGAGLRMPVVTTILLHKRAHQVPHFGQIHPLPCCVRGATGVRARCRGVEHIRQNVAQANPTRLCLVESLWRFRALCHFDIVCANILVPQE